MMDLSKEEAQAIILPISLYLIERTDEESFGKMSEKEKKRNKLFRGLLKKCFDEVKKTEMPFGETMAVRTGLIELVSEETIQEILTGNADMGLDEMAELSRIARYFIDQKKVS